MKRIVSLVLAVVLLLTYVMSFTAFAEEDEHNHEEVVETHEYVPDEDAPEDLEYPEESDETEEEADPDDANALTLDPELMAIDTPLEQKTRNSNMQNYWIHATRESSALFTKNGSENIFITYQNGKIMNAGSGASDTHFYYEPVELAHELPIYAGSFVNNDDHSYYLIFGQNNPDESDAAETMRIVKYVPDQSGYPGELTRVSSLSISGLNTYEPFTAGSCRAAAKNGYLYVYTCHTTYPAVNGEHQQENLMLVIRLSDFTLVDHFSGTVRHSFNQFVATDGSKVVTVDHGDAYPRAIVLNEYSAGDSLGEPTTVNVLNIAGEIGDNRTGVTLGGLAITPEAYLVVGTAVGTNGGTNYQGQRNVFVARISRTDVSENGMTITWLTNYSEGANVQISTPQVVRYRDVGAYIVMWTENNELHYSLYNKSGKYLRGNTPGTIYDTKRNLIPSTQYALEVGMLSDCQPVAQQERFVCWYCVGPDGTYFLYYITVGSLDSYPKVNHECDYIANLIDEPTLTTKGHYTCYCPHCHYGENTVFELDSFDERLVGPRESGEGRTIITMPTCTKPGWASYHLIYSLPDETKLEYDVEEAMPAFGHNFYNGVCRRCGVHEDDQDPCIDGHTWNDGVVTTEPTCTEAGVKTFTCTVCGDTYTQPVAALGHNYEDTEIVDPTCTEAGYTVRTCSRCGDTNNYKELPATGHVWGDWTVTVEPTCTDSGVRERTCVNCSEKQTEDVDPLGHDYAETVHAPTCTEDGYTERVCSRCGDNRKGSEVPALGHDWDEGSVSVEPTYLKEGTLTYTCDRCGEVKTVPIPKKDLPFGDIKHTAFYIPALRWSYQYGIIGGTTPTTFSPKETCTRAMIVSIIWRLSGCPKASEAYVLPFTDVKEGKYYYEAVRWASEAGVTSGTSDTRFSPNQPCTRAQIVSFVWRLSGSQKVETENPFNDVAKKRYYYYPVMWAVNTGVTAGTSATTFTPDRNCNRSEAVTFIYRYAKLTNIFPDD